MMNEKRAIPRWQLERSIKVLLEGAEKEADATLHDLNLKGCRIHLGPKLEHDALIKMRLCLGEGCSIWVEGWVAWRRPINGRGHIYGVYFTNMKDSDRQKLYEFVRQNFTDQMQKTWWGGIMTEKGGKTMDDRRVFERMAAKLSVRFLDARDDVEAEAESVDISAKGIGIVTNHELQPNDPLELWIKVTDQGEPLYTRGKAAWSKAVRPEQYRVGIELEKADLMGLARVLRRI